VISGGVGLNCVMNGLLEREAGYLEVYPFPASHDAGTSAGAALQVHRKFYPEIPFVKPESMYLGPSYTEEEILSVLRVARLSWERPDDLADKTAELIEHGKIVALFNGRMEFGPRALGNRSILADPRRHDMKDIVNSMVKHREPFRPFCPSCLEEHSGEYFDGCGIAPYMIKTYPVFPEKMREIPSVTHVDGTARVQTVSRETNPFYYDVINSFYRRTKVPVILNTSFNIKGEPIVATPVDAVRCFYGTGIDALVMPPFLLLKKPSEE
ncbi:MAG: carbamoyltransferase, partial [Candidatus Aegiribacteria sp.]|nr:carbamoyltransferase [Candidatus Aegiribacteria sp.]